MSKIETGAVEANTREMLWTFPKPGEWALRRRHKNECDATEPLTTTTTKRRTVVTTQWILPTASTPFSRIDATESFARSWCRSPDIVALTNAGSDAGLRYHQIRGASPCVTTARTSVMTVAFTTIQWYLFHTTPTESSIAAHTRDGVNAIQMTLDDLIACVTAFAQTAASTPSTLPIHLGILFLWMCLGGRARPTTIAYNVLATVTICDRARQAKRVLADRACQPHSDRHFHDFST